MRRSPGTNGWPVWKIYTQPPTRAKARKVTPRPWGCVGAAALVLLLWQGLTAVLAAVVAGQVLPILVLALGQLPLLIKLVKLAREIRQPCPDTEALAPFLGRVSRQGIRMATGQLVSWSAFAGWTPGWEDPHVFRIHLQPAPGQETRRLITVQPRRWVLPNLVALLFALFLAVILPGQGMALRACLYTTGVYLTLYLLRRWSRRILQRSESDVQEPPWVLIFDARQVSMTEVEALLMRYLPKLGQVMHQ